MGILAWGIIPPVALLCYIYSLDKVEREPVGLVVKTLLFGCLSVISALILEFIGGAIVDFIPIPLLYNLIYFFIVVAGAEEFSKRLAMKLAVWNNPEFNYVFDAVLYCVAAALGFALIENIEYMAIEGTGIALGRLIPVHTICGVFMGIYLGVSKLAESEGDMAKARNANIMSLAIPMLIHGFYDFSLSVNSGLMTMLALAAVVVLSGVAFAQIHKISQNDRRFRWGSRGAVAGTVPFNSGQPPYGNQQPMGQPVQSQPQYPTAAPQTRQVYPPQQRQVQPMPQQQGQAYPSYAQPQPHQQAYPQQPVQPQQQAYPQQVQTPYPNQSAGEQKVPPANPYQQ